MEIFPEKNEDLLITGDFGMNMEWYFSIRRTIFTQCPNLLWHLFYTLFKIKNLVKEPVCYKNPKILAGLFTSWQTVHTVSITIVYLKLVYLIFKD